MWISKKDMEELLAQVFALGWIESLMHYDAVIGKNYNEEEQLAMARWTVLQKKHVPSLNLEKKDA